MKQRFYSKKDPGMGFFFVILILFLLIAFFGLPYLPHTKPTPIIGQSIFGIITMATFLLMASLWYGTYYEIDNDTLICRSGPFFRKIPISAIRSVSKPKKIFLNQSYMSFGLSFTKSIISYNAYDDISISPGDFDAFVAALKLRNPEIEVV